MTKKRVWAVILLMLALGSLFAPVIAPFSYQSVNLPHRLEGPNRSHWLGTDELGRDIFSRLLWGGRVSLSLAAAAVTLAGGMGLSLGLLAGWRGGAVDFFLSRLMDILLALPGILLAIAVVAFLGRSFVNLVLALTLTSWVGYARVVRGLTYKLKEMPYITAARALGAPDFRVVFRHILPNLLDIFLVQAALGTAGIILTEAGLSFLGLGIQPPFPSWGGMLDQGTAYLLEAPHIAIAAGACVVLTVLGLNVLGESQEEAVL